MEFGDWNCRISTGPANNFKFSEWWRAEIPLFENGKIKMNKLKKD